VTRILHLHRHGHFVTYARPFHFNGRAKRQCVQKAETDPKIMKSRYTPLPKRKKRTGETGVQMSTPVVEPIVQIQPEITPIPLMQLATAFWAFKTLATAVDMDLFTHLSSSPMSAPELARWFNIE